MPATTDDPISIEKSNIPMMLNMMISVMAKGIRPTIDRIIDLVANSKIKVIRNTDNYDIKVTSRDAAFLIYNTNQSEE